MNERQWLRLLSSKECRPVQVSKEFDSAKIHISAFLKRNIWTAGIWCPELLLVLTLVHITGETCDVTVKISNKSARTVSCIKIDMFQRISIKGPNFKKDFAEIKLGTTKFKLTEKLEKGLTDQMRIINLPLPRNKLITSGTGSLGDDENNDEEVVLLLPSSTWGSFIAVSHYLRLRLDLPFAVGMLLRRTGT
jgi:hypothetical protein